MKILIAPNAFKNSLSASAAAYAIREGLAETNPGWTLQCFPVGDGGDGTAELMIKYLNGTDISVTVHDPLGRKINSSFGLIDAGRTAVIEMADASGLRLLSAAELDPLHASSYGTGELILAALSKKVNKIIICIGGSATVDGGVGIMQALGFRFLNKQGDKLHELPEGLTELDSIDDTFVDGRIRLCKLVVLCDVENTLLGAEGAAAVFGPQKGADKETVKKLELSLSRLRKVVLKHVGMDMTSIKRGGAAGGTAAGLATLLNAELVNGIEYFLSVTGFAQALKEADLVITGEGSIDEQTLHGKGPFGVAKDAKEKGIPVIGVAGKISLDPGNELGGYFDVLLSINNESTELAVAMANARANLKNTANYIGNTLAKEVGFYKTIFGK